MSGSSADSKPNIGLANSLSNIFKLADVNGLKWVRYVGPNSINLEAPKDDPVLNSYAKLLNEGYACSWRRLSPCTDGTSGESKDLWVFYFTELPDISDKLAEGLTEDASGNWDDGMTPESSTMLYRSLHNIIERSLMSETFLPLGKWFAKADSSVATDGSSRGCFLCSFSFFVHAHRYICASVDMRAGPHLQPLLPSHINQALGSSTGLQVILSPSGLNAVMTGHTYKLSDSGIREVLDEWKLFYPRRFAVDPSPNLPAAIEVVLGGVRMRYPSQFVFIYHGCEEPYPSPPPSNLEKDSLFDTIHETWDTAGCIDAIQQQKESTLCRCQELMPTRSSNRRPSAHLDLPLRTSTRNSSRYEPYSIGGRKMKELATPGSLNLANMPMLNVKRKLSKPGLPRYAAPDLSSPAIPRPLSPSPQSNVSTVGSSTRVGLPLPTISLSAAASLADSSTTSSGQTFTTRIKPYNQARVALITSSNKSSTSPPFSAMPTFLSNHTHSQDHEMSDQQTPREIEWWDTLTLPESTESLMSLQLPRLEILSRSSRPSLSGRDGLNSPGLSLQSPNTLAAMLSPTIVKKTASLRASNHGNNLGPERPHTPLSTNKTHTTSATMVSNGIAMERREVGPMSVETMNGVQEHTNSGDHSQTDPLLGGMVNGGGLQLDMGLLAKSRETIDLISEKAVRIEDSCPLDSLFASDEEDEGQESNHFTFGSLSRMGEERMDTSSSLNKGIKVLSAVDAVELSRIYPTPPSVELPESDLKYDEIKMEERVELCSTGWDNYVSVCDDLYVPPEFEPLSLSDLPSLTQKLPDDCIYTPISTTGEPASSAQGGSGSGNEISSSRTGSSSTEPQKFIFPPPSMLASRASIRESLTLPLTQKRPRFSPHTHMYTPHPLTSSPAYPYPKAPGRFPRHISTPAHTPLGSPYDPSITPTPLSANTNRLMPVLPEAHALYVNLSLLDSALGSNFSETLQFSAGPLMSSIQSFMKFTNKRIKLDSVADSIGNLDTGVGSTTDLLGCQDEKPIMTFGIADYPSLGFREELGVGGVMGGRSGVGAWDSPLGVLSRFVPGEAGDRSVSSDSGEPSEMDNTHSMKLIKFLELLQEYCLILCSSSSYDNQPTPTSHTLSQERSQLLLHLLEKSEEMHEKLSSRLYYSQSVMSAIRTANQLVVNAGKKLGGGGGGQLANKPTICKEDNSGAWILDLLSLPTKFMTKRLKELRIVFQNSFHHAPCLKFTTKGPLTLKDLQQLTPSQTAIGDDCLPLPLPPVLVGFDHEWLSVSPLALPAWDKLLFEPYSTKKNILYMVVVPPSVSSLSTVPVLKKYFKDLSIIFRNCNLGQHIPLEDGVGEGGIVLVSSHPDGNSSDVGTSSTSDSETDTRHSYAENKDFKRFCKKVLVSFLSTLPTNNDDLLTAHTHSTTSHDHPSTSHPPNPTSPISIVLYVLSSNPLITSNNQKATSRNFNPRPTTIDSSETPQESFQMLLTFSELLSCDEIPEAVRRKLVLQLIDPKDLLGPFSGRSGQLRSLAFSIYSRCSNDITIDKKTSLTSFGPTADRNKLDNKFNTYKIRSPAFVLSPEAPLSALGPIVGAQTHHILFDPDEPVLFCGYCVSPDRRWMLVACCDRQGELLDTAVLGIPASFDIDQSCSLALKQLWDYVLSIVAGTVFRWSVVITRFGKPSTSEIGHWPAIIPNDGLIIVNQSVRRDCKTCKISSSMPQISNVIVISVQPERNIQLFPNSDPNPSVTHVLVLPQDPRGASALTPGATEAATDDDFSLAFAFDTTQDVDSGFQDVAAGIDFGAELSGINFQDELTNSHLGFTAPVEETGPKATGYLISTSPPGELPNEFWGHERPQNFCSIFKVLLHCHRIPLERNADSPQETLGSVLLCFDALSWLTMDQVTRQRKSCLPLHLFVLSKLYQLFSLLEQPR